MKLYQNANLGHLFYTDGSQQDALELAQVWADYYAENNDVTARVQKLGSSVAIITIPNTFGALGTIQCTIETWLPQNGVIEVNPMYPPNAK